MKKLIAYIVFIFTVTHTHAQYDPQKVNKNAMSLFEQAIQRSEQGSLASTAGLLQKAIEADKNFLDAYLALASVYAKLKNHNSSIVNYEKAFAIDSNYAIDYKGLYAVQLANTGAFDKALAAVNEQLAKRAPKNNTALQRLQQQQRNYEFALAYQRSHPVTNYVFAPQNMGSSINSNEHEYFPTLSIDGSKMVFTRRINNTNEDFYYSEWKDGNWQPAKPMEGDINTDQNEAAQNISADGEWMVLTADGRREGFGNYDLYMSMSNAFGWTAPQNLGGLLNSDQWDAQPCLSPDKRSLYFASRRPGGLGGIDIYVSYMKPNGRWSSPENLGPGINTAGDDQCPFIHADNQTMYFVSDGWPGYGGDDLFVVRKDPGGQWGKPENLGYPVNTVNDEGTVFIAADGKTAFYASDRSDTKGGYDIYSFELREDVRPFKTLWVKGQVTDKKTKQGLPSVVDLTDLASKTIITSVETDAGGRYFLTLPIGKDYAFTVNRKGYLFYSDNFLMSGRVADSTYEKNIPLSPIEANATIVLRNIFFDVNKAELKPASLAELDKLVQLLNENPTVKIEISGHTDNAGKPADNLLLSNNRAKAVVNYLVSKNIAAARLTAKGYGETKPIADNKTEEGKAQNRRTEMKVISR
ncbi:MAG: PD40 domain-containing protein [Chitinophagaceae bacterium]|nr:PD40 domain-containing protein [Chitinophagaceae bacterium]